jgi:hypothetical protein
MKRVAFFVFRKYALQTASTIVVVALKRTHLLPLKRHRF